MFGYACDDNEDTPNHYAHEILKQLKTQRQHVLGPIAIQVSIEYVGGMPKRVDSKSC